ncbi:MAG: beta-galactosidase [Chloroflexi bacterium HGW-Chloroflexi-10]|nr:MAG: beta-galactosidase [Chloroflexi bacterium HGW-Chloroflexi-10]
MRLGVCYYPEHWPESLWQQDADMMRELGLKIVRLGESSWAKLEPTPAHYNWDWLDRIVQILHTAGMEIVLGTPTAAPPPWLIQQDLKKFSEVGNGQHRKIGSRRHFCANNSAYQEHTRKIITALADRYGKHPAVIGWQIDNEFGTDPTAVCYCNECVEKFRSWLQGRYRNLETLNESWGTVLWSQSFSDWSEIFPPNQMSAENNPSHVLDYARFSSDSWIAYCNLQADILRTYTHQQFITHSINHDSTHVDAFQLSKMLDFVAWNSFPTGDAEKLSLLLYAPWDSVPETAYDVGDPYITGFFHAWTHGVKNAPFWIMEQQCGHINWGEINPGLRSGTVRLWTWHAIACGAEAVMYYHWRASRFAQEQFQSGILTHDGSPDMGYQDIISFLPEGPVLQQLKEEALSSSVAILTRYEDLWALEDQPHRIGFDYRRLLFAYYRVLTALGINVDLLPEDSDISEYRLVLAPLLYLNTSTVVNHLEAYVARGGTLLLGARSGMKTESNLVVEDSLPGLLRGLVGASVGGWQSLPDDVHFSIRSEIPGLGGEVGFWIEAIHPDENEAVNALVRYMGGPLAGKIAMTEHAYGAGSVYYLGFYPLYDQLKAILKYLSHSVRNNNTHDLPDGVIVKQRGNHRIAFNFTRNEKTFVLDDKLITLPPRDFRFFLRDWS